MGPKNGIVGSNAYGTDIPQTQVDDTAVKELKNTARYSKSKEFKDLRNHLESRIDFYQTFLPDGRPAVSETDLDKQKHMWTISNCVIGELKAIIETYDSIAEHAAELGK